jgi:hemerythrin
MSASKPFPWTDQFLLGYPPMDLTHREFVDIVNAILAAPDAEVGPLLERFTRHAEKHFEEEREWMASTDFPAKDCHVDEHNAVMKSVREVAGVVAGGDVDEGRRLATELARWFPGHADYMDASLAQWMAKRRMGGVPVVLRRKATSA